MANFKRQKTWSDVKVKSGGGNDRYKLTDHVELLDYGKKAEYRQVRPVGPVAEVGIHQIKVEFKGKEMVFTKSCLAFDAEAGDRTTKKKCPYCKMANQVFKSVFFMNVIDRELEENAPRKAKPPTKAEAKTGFKSIDSDSWTPVRVVKAPPSLAARISEHNARNVVKIKGEKKQFPLSHPKHGRDLEIKYDPDAAPANQYGVMPVDDGRIPLTEEQQAYLMWDIESLMPPEEFEIAKKEAERLAKMAPKSEESEDSEGYDEDDDDDDDDDDDGGSKSKNSKAKSKKSSSKSSKKAKDEDEDDDDLDEDDDDEDNEDDDDLEDEDSQPSKSKAKSKKAKSKKAKDEDEDDDDLDADDDDNDDDLDDDGDDDNEEDDDNEDDDDDLDEDEDEDSQPSKSKAKSKKSSSKSSKKAKDEDDEEDDDDLDDLDEDDDDDDDAPKSKSKGVSKTKSTKTAKSAGRSRR